MLAMDDAMLEKSGPAVEPAQKLCLPPDADIGWANELKLLTSEEFRAARAAVE